MTATMTQASQQQATVVNEKEWVKLFPKQVTESYTSSVTFIKQLTIVAVSTITYLKSAFPEDCYYTEPFGGVKLKVLKNKCCDELAQFVCSGMQQAFEAFDKKYIHQLALCFYEGDCKPENLLEYHVFEYSYTAEGAEMSINSKNRSSRHALKYSLETVKARTYMLVRSLSLYVFQNCQQDLPLNYDVSLRLYYNEDAPEGYQAPGFQRSADRDHLEAGAPEAVCLGWVDTPYHKLVARTFLRDPFISSDQALPSDNVPEMTQADNDDFQGRTQSERFIDVTSRSGSRSAADSEPEPEAHIRCPCGKQDTRDQTLITCQYCHMYQHAACFGLLGPVPDHCCERCADLDSSRRPSDPQFLGLEHRKRDCLCLFRRTLDMCSRTATIDGDTLMTRLALNSTSVAKMLLLLQSYYIVPNTDGNDLSIPRKINPIRLKLAFKHFFQMGEEDDIAERLAAESAPPPDPVGDVLNPMEKISLHNSSNLGTVIQNPADSNQVVEDATLQQYREAILTNQDDSEELPLSGSHNPVKDVEGIGKRKRKMKTDGDDEWLPKVPKLRSGAKTKKRT